MTQLKKVTLFLSFLMSSIAFGTPLCTKAQLSAEAFSDIGAGNVTQSLLITNHSSKPCKIRANHSLIIEYPNAVTNVKVVESKKISRDFFILKPKQSICAKVHYPNGAQCNSSLNYPNVMYSYPISPNNSIIFTNNDVKSPFSITTCESPTEITVLTIDPFEKSLQSN